VRERGEPSPGIEPLDRLVTPVMEHAPYRSAERGFWVVDNGASPRGQAAVQRVLQAYPQALLVHTPLQASGLNQGENLLFAGATNGPDPQCFCQLDGRGTTAAARRGPVEPTTTPLPGERHAGKTAPVSRPP
jgi:hypothetical protein